MTLNGTALVTGVTGSIGSWMTRKLLSKGLRVVALVRAESASSARLRARNALETMGAGQYADRMEVIQGDICQENLRARLRQNSPGVSLVVHCAGVLEFGPEFAELNHQVNVTGTANLLALAEALNVPFCHFSTAYIAGKRQGRVFEKQIDVGQEFHNAYESSKCQAEMLIRDWTHRTGLSALVLRPSIVVGDSAQGRIVNFDGLYNLMRLLDSLADVIGAEEFRVAANPRATKNFVPVDYVADVAWSIIRSGRAGTYHITNPRPTPISALRDIFVDLFAIPGARLVDEEEFRRRKAGKLEWMYRKAADCYAPYLAVEPEFDRTGTDMVLNGADTEIPRMDAAFFQKLLSYARQVNWGRACRSASAPVFRPEDARVAENKQRVVEQYFGGFLAGQMHRQLLPNLKNLSATCRIVVEDIPARSWSLSIDGGRLERISQNGEDCQCTFFLSSDAFSSIVSGKLAPQQAFFEKSVNIEGDIETALKLATVLAAFFKKWPYGSDAYHAR